MYRACIFFFSSRRRHTRCSRDWSSDVCSSDLDLVRTQYGFHIIKVLDKQTAHTKPFDEVRDGLRAQAAINQAEKQATDTSDQASKAIRQSSKISLDYLAMQEHLTLAESSPRSASNPLRPLANS